MTSLVTGRHGFIGSHLTAHLEQLGHKVVSLPRELLGLTDLLSEFIEAANPDYIFHLAAYGNMSSQKDIQEIFQANVIGTWNMLKASKDIPYKAFVNFSTSKHVQEADTFYGASKVSGTYLARTFAKQYDKPIVSVEPFTVIGIGEQEAHLIPTLIRSCYTGEKMPFDPMPYHDFIDVEDFVSAVIKVAMHASDYQGQSFEIGSGTQHSNETIRYLVERLIGKKANITLVDGIRSYDSTNWVADTAKIKQLGWKKQKLLTETIADMVAVYEKQRLKA